jgi:hypothetical protein
VAADSSERSAVGKPVGWRSSCLGKAGWTYEVPESTGRVLAALAECASARLQKADRRRPESLPTAESDEWVDADMCFYLNMLKDAL